jgi:TonB family protein
VGQFRYPANRELLATSDTAGYRVILRYNYFLDKVGALLGAQNMFGWRFFRVAVLVSVFAIPATAKSPDGFRAAPDVPADAQCKQQFRAQVAAIVQSYRERDTTRGRQLIEQFRLPHTQDWFCEHLDSEQSAGLANRYDLLYANFAESFEHAVETIVANGDAELVTNLDIGEGETPTATALRPGAKLRGIVSTKPVSLFFVQFKITLKGKPATSWGDTGVHQDGAFRFLGFGGWPFWVWQNGTEGTAPRAGHFGTPPILISRVDPVYPPGARAKKIEGVVVLRILIDEDGRVKEAEVVSGGPLLTQAALGAVRQWRYKPATLGGATLNEFEATAHVNFSLHWA